MEINNETEWKSWSDKPRDLHNSASVDYTGDGSGAGANWTNDRETNMEPVHLIRARTPPPLALTWKFLRRNLQRPDAEARQINCLLATDTRAIVSRGNFYAVHARIIYFALNLELRPWPCDAGRSNDSEVCTCGSFCWREQTSRFWWI